VSDAEKDWTGFRFVAILVLRLEYLHLPVLLAAISDVHSAIYYPLSFNDGIYLTIP
jgi:hypothetical protein